MIHIDALKLITEGGEIMKKRQLFLFAIVICLGLSILMINTPSQASLPNQNETVDQDKGVHIVTLQETLSMMFDLLDKKVEKNQVKELAIQYGLIRKEQEDTLKEGVQKQELASLGTKMLEIMLKVKLQPSPRALVLKDEIVGETEEDNKNSVLIMLEGCYIEDNDEIFQAKSLVTKKEVELLITRLTSYKYIKLPIQVEQN